MFDPSVIRAALNSDYADARAGADIFMKMIRASAREGGPEEMIWLRATTTVLTRAAKEVAIDPEAQVCRMTEAIAALALRLYHVEQLIYARR